MNSSLVNQSPSVPVPSLSSQEAPVLTSRLLAGLAILCVVLPLAFFYHNPGIGLSNGYALIMVDEYVKFALLVMGGSLLLMFMAISFGRQKKWPIPPRRLQIPYGAFMAMVLISLINVTTPALALQGVLEIYLIPPAFFIVVASVAPIGLTALRSFFWVILSAGAATAVLGICQEKGIWDLANMLPRLGAGGLLFNQNLAGEYLIELIPVAAALTLIETRPQRQLIAGSITALMIVHLVFTMARGAWVGLIVGIGVSLILAWVATRKHSAALKPEAFRRRLILWIAVPLAVVGGVVALPSENAFKGEFVSIFKRGSPERIVMWKDSILMFKDHWLIGVGPDHYRVHISAYIREAAVHTKWDHSAGTYRYPFRTHNDYYQTVLELGVVGLLAQLAMFATVLLYALGGFQAAWKQRDRTRFLLLFGSLAGFCSFAGSMFFEFPMRMASTAAIGWILAGITVNLSLPAEEKVFTKIKSGYDAVAISGAIVVVVLSFSLANIIFLGSLYRSHAVVSFSQKKFEAGRYWASKATDVAPWIEHIAVDKIRLDLLTGRFADAVSTADFVLKYQPFLPPIHIYRAEALVGLGDFIAAKKGADEVVRLFPFIPEGPKVQGWLQRKIEALSLSEDHEK